jgi:hypothetical protein
MELHLLFMKHALTLSFIFQFPGNYVQLKIPPNFYPNIANSNFFCQLDTNWVKKKQQLKLYFYKYFTIFKYHLKFDQQTEVNKEIASLC